MTDAPDCPGCDSAASHRQKLGQGWWFCGACAARFLIDAAGHVVRYVAGNR